MRTSIGIDPGITGAIGAIRGDELVGVMDLRTMESGRCKWIDADDLIRVLREFRGSGPARVYVEHTHAMPGNGAQAANSQGLTLGSILAVLQVCAIPFELVSPARWKRYHGLIHPPGTTDGVRKSASLSRARQLYPAAELELVKHHNRAEALLIADFGQADYLGRTEAA
jgi:crossover junction endodeoxyribonuclease RuvC